MINYLILHLLFIVYALNTVLGRMAAPYSWTDWHRFALLAGVLFLLAVVFSPLFLTIPSFATAPALIIVGFYMMGSAIKIDFSDPSEGIPAFLTILAMPTAYSISEGIAIGVISWTIINVVTGKAKEKKISPLMYVLTILFILKYVLL